MAETQDTTIEQILITGDLAGLTPEQRLTHYNKVCALLGLNALTQPFGYYEFEGTVQLYARKDATEQLRKLHAVSITDMESTDHNNGVFVVTVKAKDRTGRTDMATGAVGTTFMKDGVVKSYTGKSLANQYMKAETKAKRRVTLSICGLGIIDESEIEDLESRDQRPTQEIIERNVKQATANATGEQKHPLPDDLGDVVVHIGKAEGQMLGRKVSELHDNILEWLKTKWIEKLNPLGASEADMKLKKAVIREWERRHAAHQKPAESLSTTTAPVDTPGDRQANVELLRHKIDDLIMTPEQFCGYLKTVGYATADTLEQLDDEQLHYLVENWQATKDLVEAMLKPKTENVSPPIPVVPERPQDQIINQAKPHRKKATPKK